MGSCGNCAGQRSQGSLGKLFQGAKHPLSRWFSLNFNLRSQPSVSPLSLRHVSHTKSAILSRPLLAQFQTSMEPPELPLPGQSLCLSFAVVFLTLKGERPGTPLLHIPRDHAGERTQVGRHLGRVLGPHCTLGRVLHSWNIRMLCEHHGHEGHKEPEGSWDPHNSPLSVLAEGLLDWAGSVRTSLQGGKLLRG